jgi:Metallo-beta-lactamase superfamily
MKPVRQDELEISIFGPGYGECVVVHLGSNHWVIVDSCRDAISGCVAPLEYLRRIDVDPSSAVHLVVGTHWHDDHVRGLSDVVRACHNARFVCASALTTAEFITMVTRYEEAGPRNPAGSGVRELYGVLRELDATHRHPEFASPNRLIFRCPAAAVVAGGRCEITSLSPSDKQVAMFWSEIADQMPAVRRTIRRTTPKSPNHLAVALWILTGHQAILLGSDLEETVDQHRGWSAIVQSAERPQGQARVFKVPHHGSENGHNDEVWDTMVASGAYALLSPFTNGSVSLPTIGDMRRIAARAGAAYLTADPKQRRPVERPPIVARAIRNHRGRLKMAEPALGHVRLRKRYGEGSRWYVSLMGGAYKLPPALPEPERTA